MTNQAHDSTFHLRPTASPLRVGGRLAVLAALCAALVGGFVAGLSATADGASQVASTHARCGARAC
jgi:hypothetical protein